MTLKEFWQSKRNWQKGLLIGFLIPIIWILYSIFVISLSYDGTCGSFIPFAQGGEECTYSEHVSQSITLLAIGMLFFWWQLVIVIAIPTLVGAYMDKKKKPKNDQEKKL